MPPLIPQRIQPAGQKQDTVQDGLSSKSSQSFVLVPPVMKVHSRQSLPGLWGSVWSPVTTCCRCSGWSEGEEGGWASKINEMVVSHQGDKLGTLTTHTVAPHNLSPVLGATNPLQQSKSDRNLLGLLQATFQAQRQLSYSSTCSRYRKAMQWDHFMTSDTSK